MRTNQYRFVFFRHKFAYQRQLPFCLVRTATSNFYCQSYPTRFMFISYQVELLSLPSRAWNGSNSFFFLPEIGVKLAHHHDPGIATSRNPHERLAFPPVARVVTTARISIVIARSHSPSSKESSGSRWKWRLGWKSLPLPAGSGAHW